MQKNNLFVNFFFLFFLTFLCLLPEITLAQIEFTSSPNPVGSGARALGMGGAFIAVADDATAASWNPAGLIQLELPEVSVVGAYFSHNEDNTFQDNPEANKEQSVTGTDLNYLSASYPFTLLERNMIVSLNYQHLFDFSRDWDFPIQLSPGQLLINSDVDYTQKGQLYVWGVAYAVQLSPKISAGLTFNFWQDGLQANEWKQKSTITGTGTFAGMFPVSYDSVERHDYDFSGFNMNIGLLWQINYHVTLGAVIKTPFTADLRHKSSLNTTIINTDTSVIMSQTVQANDEDEELEMPMSYGIGLAYRFTDSFTASLDLYRTEWDNFIHKDANGVKTSFVSGKPTAESDVDPTTQVRLGAEYLHIKSDYVIPVRCGLFYDPAPQEGGADDYYGITMGTGFAKGRIVFDIAYQFRWGNDVGESLVKTLNFSQDVREHTVYSSLIVHF